MTSKSFALYTSLSSPEMHLIGQLAAHSIILESSLLSSESSLESLELRFSSGFFILPVPPPSVSYIG